MEGEAIPQKGDRINLRRQLQYSLALNRKIDALLDFYLSTLIAVEQSWIVICIAPRYPQHPLIVSPKRRLRSARGEAAWPGYLRGFERLVKDLRVRYPLVMKVQQRFREENEELLRKENSK